MIGQKNVTSRVKKTSPGGHKTAPPPGGHVFQMFTTIFKLVPDIHITNFHDYWAKIVTSRVFTRKTATPPGGHVFQQTGTIFELNIHIIKTNILTKLQLSCGIIGTNIGQEMASRVFTRQNVDDGRKTDARRTTDKRRSQKLTMSTLCSGELKIHLTIA
ncbi:hypothetical protein DPMN_071361 [Dreissena polymorpha]|uniref:Uncharacterized protein n=1 Tax=Dreissena polymorpha TaxID=45954 RepID=A0A9D3Z7K2_DREPO|nr:hypothetical protein DPMN_071361 [Dreissena polymorpha]